MSAFADAVKLDTESNVISPEQQLNRYSKSFLKLILLGFSFIGLPLIIALINSAMSIENLSEHSRKTVYQATGMIHDNGVLIEEIVAMERSMRQAVILRDQSLLDSYLAAHTNFEAATERLLSDTLHYKQRLLLEKLQLLERTIYQQVITIQKDPDELHSLIEFVYLLESAQLLSVLGHDFIENEVNKMQAMAAHAHMVVKWQLIALVPFVIILALIFSVLITRPIRQIDEAIHTMGQGKLSQEIAINGPQNLRYLGERLDWMRRRLLKLEAQKTQFFRHVSHELKTPLAAIREGSGLLVDGVTGELTDEQEKISKIIYSSSLQLNKRIEDLLNFSALQSEKTALVKHSTSLTKILDRVLTDQHLSILSKQLRVDRNCKDLSLECEEQKISIVFDNLISNAIKFSPQGGRVEINLIKVGSSIQLDVTDRGVGIHKADWNKIFDPFYQGQNAPHSHVKGTGLGLSIAREYVVAHGGTLELMAVDVGAYFRLTLPIKDSEK